MSIEKCIEERAIRKGGFIPNSHDQGRKDWKKTRCTFCDKLVHYIPQQDFKGILSCPHCGKEFRVPSLDAFIQLKDKIKLIGFNIIID